ncbi:hypothetical protein ETB97_008455 [Aspergillus alliaceus]|uniref:Uncharacterized protein n=1 Tax=Petromyces alliaceus TaxID=209559 RepID=A0A8H5ZV42_PETAA|nr:hypothetical protein ETB97_008455 [Aspergillus burnettii]
MPRLPLFKTPTLPWNNPLINNYHRPSPQHRDQRLQDQIRILIRLIMQHIPQQIHIRAVNRLLREEIVRLELDPFAQVRREGSLGLSDDLGAVLNYAFYIGAVRYQGARDVVRSAAYADYGCFTFVEAPREVVH